MVVTSPRHLSHCLALVWWATAAVSLLGLRASAPISLQLLAAGGIRHATWAQALVVAGAALDALIGSTLWWRPGRQSAAFAMAGMVLMTLVATVLLPDLWLDPLGPLLKNLPIGALLWLLITREDAST